MKTVYRVLASLIAIGVIVQAMAMVLGVAGLEKWVDNGGVFNAATAEDEQLPFSQGIGFVIHGMNGMMVIPALALLLLITSFFARIPGGTWWALGVAALVAIQVTLGLMAHDYPNLGALHGLNAFLLFGAAVWAARRRPVINLPSDTDAAGTTSVTDSTQQMRSERGTA